MDVSFGGFPMSLEMKVTSMVCEGCVETVTNTIKNVDNSATVTIDLPTKVVQVETQASETAIKEAIAAAGHEVE
jgi:copper chaperone